MNIIPEKSSRSVKKDHDIEKWKLYARQITKNKFVRDYLKLKYNSECQWCFNKIHNEYFVVHHKDYDHECCCNVLIKILSPTPKRPNRLVKVPDCETCYNTKIDNFNECMSKLAPVHSGCNWDISKAYMTVKKLD